MGDARARRRELTAWLPYRNARVAAPEVRLFCLPFAGGTAGTYLAWRDAAPAWLEVCPVQLPGRDQRIVEEPHTEMDLLVADLVDVLGPVLDRPFAFFGHSMGGLVGYEVTRVLHEAGGPRPVGLFVSGTRPPHVPLPGPPLHDLSDDEMVDELRRAGGTPPEIFRLTELMELLMPTIRADLRVAERYPERDHPPLDVPISGFSGRHDRLAGTEDMRQWERYTATGYRLRDYDAGHFFIHDELDSMTTAVAGDLRSWIGALEGAP